MAAQHNGTLKQNPTANPPKANEKALSLWDRGDAGKWRPVVSADGPIGESEIWNKHWKKTFAGELLIAKPAYCLYSCLYS